MLSLSDEFHAVIAALEHAGVEYGVVGALALAVNENLEEIWASRAAIETESGPIRVISREALIKMKLQANRPQDVADVERLNGGDR